MFPVEKDSKEKETEFTELLSLDGNFHVNIDAIEHRVGDAFLVFGNDSRSTPTGFCGN